MSCFKLMMFSFSFSFHSLKPQQYFFLLRILSLPVTSTWVNSNFLFLIMQVLTHYTYSELNKSRLIKNSPNSLC